MHLLKFLAVPAVCDVILHISQKNEPRCWSNFTFGIESGALKVLGVRLEEGLFVMYDTTCVR